LNETYIKAVQTLSQKQDELIRPILKQEESASKIALTTISENKETGK